MKLAVLVLFLSKIKSSTGGYKIRIVTCEEKESIQRDKQLMGKNLAEFAKIVNSKQRNGQVVTRKYFEIIDEETSNERIETINLDFPESLRCNHLENFGTEECIPLRILRKNEENHKFECINQDNESDDGDEELKFNLNYSIEKFLVASLKYFMIENTQSKTIYYIKMTCEDNPFTYYHYKSYKKCFWDLWTLSTKLKFMNFKRNTFSVSKKMFSLFSCTQQNIRFMDKLYERICFKYESKLYDQMQVQLTQSDFKNLVKVIINELSSVKRFFLITDDYTEEKYIEVCASMIIDLIKSSSENIAQQIIEYCNKNIKSELNKLQYDFESELTTFDYLIKQVCDKNKISPRNIGDYKTLEKIICDYFNLCLYLSSSSKTLLPHLAPKNNYKQQPKLLKMAEIELEEYGSIQDVKCCDSNGNETVLKINKDFFVGRNYQTLYLSLDLIREKNTQYLRIYVDGDNIVTIDLKNHPEFLYPENGI